MNIKKMLSGLKCLRVAMMYDLDFTTFSKMILKSKPGRVIQVTI